LGAARDSVRLALVAGLQVLAPRQRAVLLLRDVLGWPAAEVAEALGMTTTAVKSILQRARARLGEVSPETTEEPDEPEFRAVLERYIAAFENSDLAALTELLRADATIQTPPSPTWYSGVATCLKFLALHAMDRPGDWRFLRIRANGRPAAAAYHLGPDGAYHVAGLSLLETDRKQITGIVFDTEPRLFELFELPAVLSAAELDRRESAGPVR
jgi:RNA polymerase sigma-70 factor (ECF subfamily)